ncbi:hypothetical protein V5799_004488, partial [Amblyomma americanum]
MEDPLSGPSRRSLLVRNRTAAQQLASLLPEGSCSPVRLSRPYSEALRPSPLRFPQSTLSVPVPAPRQRVLFSGKGLLQVPSIAVPRRDSRLHAKVAQSGPLKDQHDS